MLSMIFLSVIPAGGICAEQQRGTTDDTQRSGTEIKQSDIDESHLTLMGLTIGKSTLSDVIGKLGDTEFFKSDEKEHADDRICYRSDSKIDEIVVIFDAGALGGWSTITSVTLAYADKANVVDTRSCKRIALVKRQASTKSGIRLGIDLSELERILGKPNEIENEIASYHYYSQKRMSDKEVRRYENLGTGVRNYPYFDVMSGVEATFRNSRLVLVTIHKTESY
ncbi:MAG: hypothetical protein ACYC7L_07645 [Nitrospirota bacterium]